MSIECGGYLERAESVVSRLLRAAERIGWGGFERDGRVLDEISEQREAGEGKEAMLH